MLPSVFTTCEPRAEIRTGDLSLDLFAAKLRLVVEGRAPTVYGDPVSFFANTFATDGLKTLIKEVFGRLSGSIVGSPIIRLETSFGGGKTHDEIALWHIAKQGRQIEGLNRFVDDLSLLPDRPVQVAAVDGRDLDPESGVYHAESGITTYTLWGEIAYQLGGIEGYQLLRGADENRISPGTSVLERLVKDEPTVIVVDEIARYLRAAKAKLVGQSTLAEQVVAFFFSLMDQAASCNNLVLVYSLASESDTFAKETAEVHQELARASARQERVLSPSTDIEVYNIVRQRLFASISDAAAGKAADAYLQAFRASRMTLPDGCKDASYAQAIANSYPFHPELFSLLTKKVASIPEFQRTRGALRLFARLVRYLWRQTPQPHTPLIHSHHIPLGLEEEITGDLTSRLQRPLMRLPISADIYNPDGREAHAQIQDQDWQSAGKPPFSSWVGRTIFLHSLTQGITSGIRRTELNLSLVTPGLEAGFIDRALERLSSVAWYLDVDPITSIARFKEEPSINKIIAEEKEQIGISEAKDDLRRRRDTLFATRFFELVSGPEAAHDVDDVADKPALCLIDFNEATLDSSQAGPPPVVEQIFNNTGESGKFRTFRNRLLFLLANTQDLGRALDLAREFKAIKAILGSADRLNDLSESQQRQLREKEGKMDLDVRIALTNAYRHLFYPSNDSVKAPKGLMHYPLPPQDASTVKGNNHQDVVLKVLKDCAKVRDENAEAYAPAYVLQKVWPPGIDHWTTKALRDQFAKDLSLNMLLGGEASKLRETLRRGLQDGQWDMKIGTSLYIKTDTPPPVPETIEFSDRMELYRRGLLKPPEPRVVELDAQLLAGGTTERSVQVRWRAREAIRVSLYQDGQKVESDREFLPSDVYEGKISRTTQFRLVADYGDGEQAERTAVATIYGTGDGPKPGNGNEGKGNYGDTALLNRPTEVTLTGSPTKVFNDLADWVVDKQPQTINRLTLSVTDTVDYRKLGTSLSLLGRYALQITQNVTLQTGQGQQFVRLEYQGDAPGFRTFFGPINAMLNNPETQADVSLILEFSFDPAIATNGPELNALKQALTRNPVERMNLVVRVDY
jgi:hypothetical protein